MSHHLKATYRTILTDLLTVMAYLQESQCSQKLTQAVPLAQQNGKNARPRTHTCGGAVACEERMMGGMAICNAPLINYEHSMCSSSSSSSSNDKPRAGCTCVNRRHKASRRNYHLWPLWHASSPPL